MEPSKERLADAVAKLKQERDELRLKVRLGTMEAKDEWKELEAKWRTLEARLSDTKDGARVKAQGAREGVGVIAEELRAAYRRIRERLTADE
jgi:ribosomal protein S5